MKKIGICNNKGGVGKTTICFCLGGALAEMGKKVLLVDMDQQGSLSSSSLKGISEPVKIYSIVGINGQHNVHLSEVNIEHSNDRCVIDSNEDLA